jgi:hypothetical protein
MSSPLITALVTSRPLDMTPDMVDAVLLRPDYKAAAQAFAAGYKTRFHDGRD